MRFRIYDLRCTSVREITPVSGGVVAQGAALADILLTGKLAGWATGAPGAAGRTSSAARTTSNTNQPTN